MKRTVIDQVVEAVLIRPSAEDVLDGIEEVVRVRLDCGMSFEMKVCEDIPYTGQTVRVDITWGDDYMAPVFPMPTRRWVG